MVRRLDTTSFRATAQGNRRIASSTGKAVGAALACLLVTSLVVDRSIAAIDPGRTGSSVAIGAAAIELTDDDQGQSLVNLSNMIPGRTHTSCINVTYNGTLLPADLVLAVEASGALTDLISVVLEEGSEGSFDDCGGFEPERVIHRGTLAALAQEPMVISRLLSTVESKTYRFSFEIADAEVAIGKTATADFVWEVQAP